MCRVSGYEVFERLKDRYTPAEIVELLDVTNEDLEDIGIAGYIADNLGELFGLLEEAGVITSDET